MNIQRGSIVSVSSWAACLAQYTDQAFLDFATFNFAASKQVRMQHCNGLLIGVSIAWMVASEEGEIGAVLKLLRSAGGLRMSLKLRKKKSVLLGCSRKWE